MIAGAALLAGNRAAGAPLDGPSGIAVVAGRVTTPDGAAVDAAAVPIQWRPGETCDGVLPADSVSTDAHGAYTALVGQWGSGFTACIDAWGTPPPGSGVGADSVYPAGVARRSRGAADTMQRDIDLPQRE